VNKKVKPFALILFLALIGIAFVASAPSVNVEMLENKCDSEYGEINCYTIYEITNPSGTPISIDNTNFGIKWRSDLKPALSDTLDSVTKVKLELNNGPSYGELDLVSSNVLSPLSSITIKVSGKKVWQKIGDNEWYLPNVDNVISAFGTDFTEYAWWNTSYNYKEKINLTLVKNATRSNWVYSKNITQLVTDGKIDQFGHCYKLLDSSETSLLNYEYEYSDIGQNLTLWVVNDNLIYNTSGTDRWGYYGNLQGCSIGNGNIETNYNITGAIVVIHFSNTSSMTPTSFDSVSNPAYNASNTTNAYGGIINSDTGKALMFKQAINQQIDLSGKLGAGFTQGTIFMIINATTFGSNQFLTSRGAFFEPRDLTSSIQSSGALAFSADGATNILGNAVLLSNKWYPVAFTWNSTSWEIWINGTLDATALKTGVVNSSFKSTFSIGAIQGYTGTEYFKGSISEFQFYNRTLNSTEIYLLSTYFSRPVSSETPYDNTTDPLASFYVLDLQTNQQIYFNMSFDNTTSTLQTATNLSYTNYSKFLPQSINTIAIQNASYYTSTFILNIANTSYNVINYLIPRSNANAIFVRFHIQNSQGAFIPNALVTITQAGRNIGSSYTDSSGTASFYLDSTLSFLISVSAPGYSSTTTSVVPVGNDYTLSLGSGSTYIGYNVSFDNIYVSFFPDMVDYSNNFSILNYTIISTDSKLAQFGILVYYNATLIYSQTNNSPASGGVILVNVTTFGRNGNIAVSYFFQKSGESIVYLNKVYLIYSEFGKYPGTLSDVAKELRQYGKPPFLILIPILCIIGLIMSWLNRGLSIGLGLGVFAMILLFFGLQFITTDPGDLLLWTFLFIVALALVKLRSGQ
jgi:hypothetical protein